MKVKIPTPAGCIEVNDERIAENVRKMVEKIYMYKNVSAQNSTEDEARYNFRINTNSGVAFIRNFEEKRSFENALVKTEKSKCEFITIN